MFTKATLVVLPSQFVRTHISGVAGIFFIF